MTEVKDAMKEFLLDKATYCAPKTLDNYSDHLERFQASGKVPRYVEELSPGTIRTYIIGMREEGIRSVTIQSYMRSVKVFCRWLYDEGYLENNIAQGIRLPRADPKIKQPLTQEEARLIDQELPETRDRIIFHLMLDAGLRESEVCSLKKEDVDLEHGFIKIWNSKYNRNRLVPLCPRLKNWIRYHRSGSSYLLTGKNGEKLTTDLIKQLFQRLKKKTGISRVHAHLCRHTFATSYIMGGGNLEKLRVMLGHSDYNVTQIYIRMAAEYEIIKYPIYQLDPVFFERGY